jgi:hypothetical protein
MQANNSADFHLIYGARKPRAVYYKKDFFDYVLMLSLSVLILILAYGLRSAMSIAGIALCLFMMIAFVLRHGIEAKVPLLFRIPHAALYMVFYKVKNLKPTYFAALGLLVVENLVIAVTPNLPHYTRLMREVALYLFYTHFLAITLFRTVILIDHLAKKELVREVLMQTAWRRAIKEDTNVTLEIVHAYCTGLLTHIILLAPWYLVITHLQFSVLLLPLACLGEVMIHLKWMKLMNEWFYRDHWLGHNSEFEFVFLHGTHHDAIPSGLMAVAENGFLEGFLRFTLGAPSTYYNPLVAFLVLTATIKKDIEAHQYIPGVFPRQSRQFVEASQHSTHHYGPIEPYSLGLKMEAVTSSEAYKKGLARFLTPEELLTSVRLDEELNGFKWENPTYHRTISLYDKYQQ